MEIYPLTIVDILTIDKAPFSQGNGSINYICGNGFCNTVLVEGGNEGEVEHLYFECPKCKKINHYISAKLAQ
jgi:phage FluMu protein Com